MSVYWGIFNRNEQAVDKKLVDDLQTNMSYWNLDEQNAVSLGSVALGHSMLWNTPESKYEHLPLEEKSYILTMDARIDNREELSNKIELPDKPMLEIGDSEFILGAYKKWGEACPKYLLGDFSFAIWDAKKEHIFCARDHVGVKQLYYHIEKEYCLFGNDLSSLVTYPGISKELKDEAVANYLVNHLLLSDRLTLLRDFKKLLPAHCMTISAKEVKETCYWKLEDIPKRKVKSIDACVEELRDLLEKAVYARLRTKYPVSSHLSGGLDSSSIAVLSARKLKEKGEKLLAFNWVPEPSEKDDVAQEEWSNSVKIANLEGIEHQYVTLNAKEICDYRKKRRVVFGDSAIFWEEFPVRQAAKEKHSRVILSGWGGDEFITNHGRSFYSDLFLKGKWGNFTRELKLRIKDSDRKIKDLLLLVYNVVVIPLVPRKLYCGMPRITCLKMPLPPIKDWFVRYIKEERRKPSELSMQQQATIRDDMMAYWRYGHLQGRIESWTTAALPMHLEYRFPLLDKRILEFAISLPPELFVHNGIRRYIYGLSTQDLFPKNFNIQKISEPNRVDRLIEVILQSYKLEIENGEILQSQSKYVDIIKLKNGSKGIKFPIPSKEKNWSFDDTETAFSLLCQT